MRCVWQNDANCLAVSEAIDGAAASAQTVFAVILVPAGGRCRRSARDAHIMVTVRQASGDITHCHGWMKTNLKYRTEVPCYCGKQGCIETFISGTGFATDYHRLSVVSRLRE